MKTKVWVSLFISIIFFSLLSCTKFDNNSLTVVAKLKGKPSAGIRVFLKELYPIEGIGRDVEQITNIEGIATFDGIKDDMYEVWVVYPGYEEVRQRFPLYDGKNIKVRTSLKEKMLPSNFKRLYAYGDFNAWDTKNAIELHKKENGLWEAIIDTIKADSISYYLYFDQPYKQFYNAQSKRLRYQAGHQPPFQSIEYKENGEYRIIFDEKNYTKSDAPFLSHWVERDIEGINAQEFILFEKLMTENFQLLSEILFEISNIQSIQIISKEDRNLVKAKLDSLNDRSAVKKMLANILNFSEEYDGLIYDLAKIELAHIYWILGQIGNAHKTADMVDLNSFAGGEAYEISTSNSMRIPRGFSEYTRKKLKIIKNRKTRFILRQKLALAYSVLNDKKDEYRLALENIIDEFPETELAASSKKALIELNSEKEKDKSESKEKEKK